MKRAWGLWTIGVLVAAAVAMSILVKAYRASAGDDFWSVAVPGVLTGVGTLALAASTVALAYQERRRDDQLRAAERERNAALRQQTDLIALSRQRRQQAESVSAWYGGRNPLTRPSGFGLSNGNVVVELSNGSQELVYEVVIFKVYIQGTSPRTGEGWVNTFFKDGNFEQPMFAMYKVLGVLQPGRSSVELPWTDPPMQGRLGIELAFTDRSGVSWVRRSTGALEEASASPIDHYGLFRPVDYEVAQSL